MVDLITRVFRVVHLPHRRREAENTTDGAPTEVQPGELLYGEEENTLYVGKEDGTVAVVAGADNDADYVTSVTTDISGALQITNIVKISQTNYDALITKNESTLYIIDG